MAHLLKAIQRERRRTGLGDSLTAHRRHSVLRSSKPKARRKYLVCAKGLRNPLDNMIEFFAERNRAERQRMPSPSGRMVHYMQGVGKATSKERRKLNNREPAQQVVAQGGQRRMGSLYIHQAQSTYINVTLI